MDAVVMCLNVNLRWIAGSYNNTVYNTTISIVAR